MSRTQSARAHGSWTSPFESRGISERSLRLSLPRLDRGDLYWLEGRPSEGGRQAVVAARGAAGPADVTPPAVNVRTRVHEYGGGDYGVRDGALVFSDFSDQRVYRMDASGGAVRALTALGAGYADFEISPDGRWLLAVEEKPRAEGEPENRLVAIPLAVPGAARVVSQGTDFVSSPRFSPSGDRLAFTVWSHPQMPWDGTRLRVIGWSAEGPTGAAREIAGGVDESVVQPGFSPGGVLTFVSDRSGWWNLYQQRESGAVAVCARESEFGLPPWIFALSSYAFIGETRLLCVETRSGSDRLCRLDLETGVLEDLSLPFTYVRDLRVEADRACFVAASNTRAAGIWTLEWETGALHEHRSTLMDPVDPAFVSVPEAIEFESEEGTRAHAWLYRPRHPEFTGLASERPPLLVKSHGGPTSAATDALDLRIQFWTSRGIGVVDVNYRGSAGYGRAYREALRGAWGIADVRDCVGAAHATCDRGLADPARLAITGGSAGGYTTLCALTFYDSFRAGASHYGIGDLAAMARDTHKFEARYLDGLVGPWPECRERYRERSPIHFTEQLSCPVIFFQGLDDRVVPPSQAEAMVAALARRGIAHAYVPFEGERHGFRRSENIRAALNGELWFYSRVFGFETDVRPEGVNLVEGAGLSSRSV